MGGDEPDGGPNGPPSSAAPSAPSRVGSAGGVVALVLGVLMFLGGAGMMAGGAAMLGVDTTRDAAGFLSSDRFTVASQTAAITAEGIRIHPGRAFGREFAPLEAVRITATTKGQQALFIGVALERDVDAWLFGITHDELQNLYGDRVTYQRSAGSLRAVSSPADQRFWLATSTGTGTVTLDWVPGSGRFAIVVTNVDGSLGVRAEVVAAAAVPLLRSAARGLLGGGLVLVVLAIGLILVGAVSLAGSAGSTGAGPQGGQPPPGPVDAQPPPELVRAG